MTVMQTPESDITSSLQDYLETITELGKYGVRVTDMADHLQVSKASVNRAVNRLKLLGLVEQEPYGLLSLTVEGLEQADKVLQRHLLIRSFLITVLGVDADVAETDACRIEHHISAETLQGMTNMLQAKQA